jgi:hypothetical protein
MRTRIPEKFHTIATDIEFLLISVIQGLAIQMLAVAATGPMSNFEFQYAGYIVSAFILILVFWTLAITHALSFIRWPIDIVHTFLYFLASFMEVLAFNHITMPLKWFIFGSFFLIVASLMYWYDLTMIKKAKKDFEGTKAKRELYREMYVEQVREMRFLLPGALFFNLVCAGIIFWYPDIYLTQKYHVVLSSIQVLFSVFLLLRLIKEFNKRSRLLVQ